MSGVRGARSILFASSLVDKHKISYAFLAIFMKQLSCLLNLVDMLQPEPVDRVQRFLSYTFQRRELSELALTAPGADEANYEGNRSLALKGALAMELVLTRELEGRGLKCGK